MKFSDLGRAFSNPLGSLVGQAGGLLGGGGGGFFTKIKEAVMQMQAPASPTLDALKDLRPPTIDQARLRREQSEAFLRKRGRRSSILTGPEGVGTTPVGTKTLIGT